MRLTAWHAALTLSVTAHAATLGWGALHPAATTAVPPGDTAADHVRLTVVAVASLPSPRRPNSDASSTAAPHPQAATRRDSPVADRLPDSARVVPASQPRVAGASLADVQRVAAHMLAAPPPATVALDDGPPVRESVPAGGRPAVSVLGDSAPAVPVRGQNPPPRYPRVARRHGWEGAVLLDVQIDPTGRVQSITVGRSSGYAVLDAAAVDAVRAWRFAPARVGGLALHSSARVPIIFRLEE